MPELKHNFLKGRMNKDLDERLVPNGEYRDALNVEVSTSEDSNVGTVQTVMGNVKLSSLPIMDSTKCVGKILDEKNDKLYWLVSEAGNQPSTFGNNEPPVYGDFVITDLIMEFDSITNSARPIVVDTFYTAVTLTGYDARQGGGDWISVSSINWSGDMPYVIYPGMEIDCISPGGNPIFPPGTVVVDVNLNQWQVRLSNKPIGVISNPQADLYQLKFENFNRALNFQNEQLSASSVITGINIVDDFLFWTDNQSEPKKINIKKCRREREINPYVSNAITDFQSQSMLVISSTTSTIPGALIIGRGNSPWTQTAPIPLKEEHITVIRKSPLTALNLEMRNTPREGNIAGAIDYTDPSGRVIDPVTYPCQTSTTAVPYIPSAGYNPFWDKGNAKVRESTWVNFGGPNSKIFQDPFVPAGDCANGRAATCPVYETGDILVFTTLATPEDIIRAKVTNRDRLYGGYGLDILSFSPTISDTDQIFNVMLEQPDPLFEFKFPRFSYRYKYEDGEYSAFAPFSEIAFLPEKFEYLPKKGYNLGMTNNLRKLVIKDFVDNKLLPPDVISIDILYKESNSSSIYTVKTITRNDFEWDAISIDTKAQDDNGRYIGTRGYLNIESEMIHAILPSNQLLRPWDNVPRKALAQEITKNRLVYGNYLQNYDMRDSNNAHININLELTSISKIVGEEDGVSFHYSPEQRDENNAYRYDPSKSIKTLRTYQLGVVYRDKYGRETPVFSTNIKGASDDTGRASLYLEKTLANQQNKLKAQIKNNPPAWAESFKFFIKETSNEYYNLAMDRWYDAADENIWLSFPSSERNKVDIDTFLVLKKAKDTNEAILDPARYKILAIENEAPLFIKTREQNFGKLSDGSINLKTKNVFRTDDGTTSTGFPVENASYMYVHADKFGSDLDGGSQGLGWHKSLLQAGRGNLYMRMRTHSITSNWYKITSVSHEPRVSTEGSLGMYRIDIEEGIFGEDMNITCSDPNNINDNTISAGLSLEIKQNIVEHRPEFEGRFFVKIYKDQLIVDKIIKPSLEAVEYSVQVAKEIGYINDNIGTNRTVAPHGSSSTFVSEGMNPSTWAATNGWTGTTQTISLGPFTYSGLVGVQGLADGTALSNIKDENDDANPAPGWDDFESFWSNHNGWFIDQCSGFHYIGGDWWYTGGAGGHGQPVISFDDDHKDDKVRNHAGRGIWDNGRMMNLSYTKVGSGERDTTPYERSIFEESKYSNEVSFITKLTAQGTLFRWKEDPDRHIYVTEATWQPGGGHDGNMAFGEHLYNFHNWCGTSPSRPCISRHNYDWAMRNRFRIRAKRLLDGEPMGAAGGYGAEYLPVNDPSEESWFDSDGNNLMEKGTCSDTSFNNDEQGCTDAGGSWTIHADNFNASGNSVPTTRAPGIRQDFHGPAEPNMANIGGSVANDFSDQPGRVTLQILEPITRGQSLENASTNPAVWETEPKEDIGLDIYHEVGQIYPIEINDKTNEQFAPIGSVVGCYRPSVGTVILGGATTSAWVPPIRVKSWDDNIVTLEDDTGVLFEGDMLWLNEHARPGDKLTFKRSDGSKSEATLEYYGGFGTPAPNSPAYEYTLARGIHQGVKTLPWSNCYSFGNGVESDRVRDDYNQVTIDNGPKASTTLEEPYLEERRGSGLIYSGIYNSMSGINNLNQFVQAEAITKDINPTYGSIQKLHTRDTDLVTLCEDKVLKILANKDALFNADGDANITATSNVLGQTTPFVGEYGISKNPESFTSEAFRAYFTDKQRGAVLRLSRDGLTPISDAGMKDWFADNLPLADYLIGNYDDKKSTYNLTLDANRTGSGYLMEEPTTISFGEKIKGWSSFKSFIPETGESLNNGYYTFKQGNIWKHHDDSVERNSFYNETGIKNLDINSTVTVLLNDDPGTVKGFQTLNYEGTQARITENHDDGGDSVWAHEYYNNIAKDGWYVDNMKTNLQETEELEFKGKEEKWFSQIKGVTTELSNVDTKEFSVQGIGNATTINAPPISGCTDEEALNYLPNATIDDDSCIYCVYGCMTVGSSNYDPLATCDDDSCEPCIYGCMNSTSSNYNSNATCDDGSCLQCIYGCMDSTASDYDPTATCDDGSCTYLTPESWDCVEGACIDPGDGSGLYATALLCAEFCVPPSPCPPSDHSSPYYQQPYTGAVNTNWCAECNYAGPGSAFWTQFPDCICCTSAPLIESWDCENGTCYDPGDGNGIYPTQAACEAICNPIVIVGCTDPLATNYNPAATIDDDSCIYLCDEVWIPTIDKIIPDSGSCLTPTIPNLNYSNFDGEMFASGIIPNWHNGDTWHWNVIMMPNSLTSWPQGGSGQFSTPNVNVHFQGPPPPLGSNWMEWVTYGDYMLVVTHYRNGGDSSPTGECTYTVEFTIGCTQT